MATEHTTDDEPTAFSNTQEPDEPRWLPWPTRGGWWWCHHLGASGYVNRLFLVDSDLCVWSDGDREMYRRGDMRRDERFLDARLVSPTPPKE